MKKKGEQLQKDMDKLTKELGMKN